jgi:hypothetical protein
VALILNVSVSAVLAVVFRRMGLQDGYDETRPADYTADPVTARAVPAQAKTPAIRADPGNTTGIRGHRKAIR